MTVDMIATIEHHIHHPVEEAIVEVIEEGLGVMRRIEQKARGLIKMVDLVIRKSGIHAQGPVPVKQGSEEEMGRPSAASGTGIG